MRMRTAHGGSLLGWLPEYWYDVEKGWWRRHDGSGLPSHVHGADLLGKPVRIASMFNTTCAPEPAEDNAVSVVEFQNKAIAVLETSFVSPWQAECFELLGTEGALVAVGRDVKIRSNSFGVDGWVTVDKLPDPRPMAMRMWFDGILNGSPIPFDTAKGEKLTELLENAYVSHREQRIVEILKRAASC